MLSANGWNFTYGGSQRVQGDTARILPPFPFLIKYLTQGITVSHIECETQNSIVLLKPLNVQTYR